jgi:hypothetical protein
MMRTDPLVQRLIDATREGPVESWLSRMAVYVAAAGLRTECVGWVGSPEVVAGNVVGLAQRHGLTAALAKALGA